MARPEGYYTKGRVRVPSVTTIIKHCDGDAEPLLRWAWKCGSEGIPLEQARMAAIGIGKVTHAAIEADLKGQPVDLSAVDAHTRAGVDSSMAAWDAWKRQAGLELVLATEYPMVSEKLLYGGTLDSVLQCKGRRILFDVKTAARLYPKDLVQVAAYGILWNETHPDQPIDSYSLLRLDKENGSFSWKFQDDVGMEPARLAFLRSLDLYGYVSTLKKLVA